MNRKKILWITPYFFIPPDTGSKIRIWNLYKNVSGEFEIYGISFYEKKKEKESPIRNVPENFFVFGRDFYLYGEKFIKFLYSVFAFTPLYVNNYKVKEAEEKVKEIIEKEDIKIIQADEIYTAQYLFTVPDVKKILVLHNVDSLFFWRSFLHHPNPLRKLFFLLQFFKMRSYEKKIIPKADKVFCVSEKDKEIFEKIFKGRIMFEVLPNGVDTEKIKPLPYAEKPVLIYVGAMRYHPNVLAVKWFIEKVFPFVLREIPDACFYVIGGGVPKKLKKYEKKYPVKFVGYVENLKQWYEKAKITVIPLKIGSGTRLKIFESMAYGKPVVSTVLGAEGIEVKNGGNILILIADTPEKFAEKIILLHRDRKLYESIKTNVRTLIEEKYDWKKISEKLKNTYYHPLFNRGG